MKLVELLARELDVWPGCAEVATQDGGGMVCFSRGPLPVFGAKYDDEWSFDQSGAIDCDGRLSLLLATDHATAIITRADWQAERERIAGDWIAWGGGACPVDKGALIDTQHRDGQERRGSVCGQYGNRTRHMFWSHDGDRAEVIAYRLHKPEQASAEAIEAGIAAADAGQVKPIEELKARYDQQPQQEQEEMTPCEKLGYKVGDLFVVTENSWFEEGDEISLTDDDGTECPRFERVDGTRNGFESFSYIRKITDKPTVNIETPSTDDPRTIRNRILEIDRTTEALEEERGQLVQRLADEGFVLARVDGKVAPVEDVSDWRNWREGDLLMVVSADQSDPFIAGDIVELVEVKADKSLAYVKSETESGWNMTVDEVKFHSRPAD